MKLSYGICFVEQEKAGAWPHDCGESLWGSLSWCAAEETMWSMNF